MPIMQHAPRRNKVTMTMGEIIDALAAMPEDAPVQFAGGGLDGKQPMWPEPWAGFDWHYSVGYTDPGGPADDWVYPWADLVRSWFQADLDLSPGREFEPSSGVSTATPVWVDRPGEAGFRGAITGIRLAEWGVLIDVVRGAA